MATTGNNHNSSNQPRRKRNKKPVKRYSEEYSNRPNPYTGYSADGNYHPEAMKRSGSNAQSERSRSNDEARHSSINATMADAGWGSVQTPAPAQQTADQGAFVPPTVTVPPPKWAVSNNLTRQQLAAQEASHTENASGSSSDTPKEAQTSAPESDNSSSSAASVQQRTPTGGHRRRSHRSKEENERERAAKTEAKRAAVEKIAHGVAAHSVSEQMIDDISSMSDVFEKIPRNPKPAAETGINWEEFYDAAFPPKAEDNSKFAAKKNKHPKKRIDFKEDSADAPMIVKPVTLGDDDLLPYDKIARENALEEAEAKAAQEAKIKAEAKAKAKTEAETRAKTGAEEKAEEKAKSEAKAHMGSEKKAREKAEKSDDPIDNMFPELIIPEAGDAAEDALEDISELAGVISIEEILASVEKQKRESAAGTEAVRRSAEFAMNTAFSFDSEADESWNEAIPPRSKPATSEDQPSQDIGPELPSAFDEPAVKEEVIPPPSVEEEDIEAVDLIRFLAEKKEEPAEESGQTRQEESQTAAQEEDRAQAAMQEDSAQEFVPEIIVDSAMLEKEEQTEAASPEKEEVTEPVFVEEETPQPDVDVIIADFEDEIFAEESIEPPEGAIETGSDSDKGIEVEDKIEKLAEAAEIAEVFRIESEDMLEEETQHTGKTDIFSVSIDDIVVAPEVRTADEEEIKQYKPREKTRESDENLFESVLIVDENPNLIDPAASAGQDDTLFLHSKEQPENPTAVFKLPEGPIVFPTDIDDAEFQEQWLDEDEDGDDMASRNKRTRRRISAFIGAVALLFAVMILFSAVRTVVSGFTNIGSTSEKKTEYTEFISPVVVNDPMPFETLDKADNNMLLKSSIWFALKELDETEGYEHVSDATNKIVLPAEMVESAARELFGKEVKLNMNVLSEYDGSAIYYYDSIDDSFHITRSGITGPSAVITKIAQKSDYISLVVGYVSQEEMSLTSSESNEEECYKFMEYILGLNSDGSYYIKSIRNYVED